MGSSALRGHRGGRTDLHLWGDDGYLIVEPALKVFTGRLADEAVPTTRWQSLQSEHGVDIRAIYVSRLASALARNERPDVTAQDALAVQAVIEAAYRSAQTGETVRPAELLTDSTP
jgi:predicted dehydrogenase